MSGVAGQAAGGTTIAKRTAATGRKQGFRWRATGASDIRPAIHTMSGLGMNQPRPSAGVRRPRRKWAERARPLMPLLLLPLAILAAFVVGFPDDGWRTPHEAWRSIDPRSLVPLPRLGLEALSTAVARWLLTAALAAPVGAIVWAWRGSTRGIGCLAACVWRSAFPCCSSCLACSSRAQVPDFRDPLIAALVAPAVWWLLRLLPCQPVTGLPRHGPWQTRWRVLPRICVGWLRNWAGCRRSLRGGHGSGAWPDAGADRCTGRAPSRGPQRAPPRS